VAFYLKSVPYYFNMTGYSRKMRCSYCCCLCPCRTFPFLLIGIILVQINRFRRVGIAILRYVIRFLTGKNFYGVTSGFQAYNHRAISFMARHYPTDFPEPETFIRAGLFVKGIPVTMKDVPYFLQSRD
jgi:hypothetical protein